LEANKPIPSRGSAKADPSQSLLSERRPGPAEHPHDQPHASPSAHGPKPDAGSGDRAYKGQWVKAGRRVGRPGLQGIFFGGNPSGSGIGPERALEANKPIPSRGSAKADPSQSLLSERRPGPAEHPHDHAHSYPSAHGPRPDAVSGDLAYKGQWVKAGRRVRRPGLQGIFFGGNPSGSGIGPERALEANKPIPSRGSAKADPSQSLLSERRRDPAERPHDTDCNQRRRFRFLSERRTDPAEHPHDQANS
jgi:hypothetical protein